MAKRGRRNKAEWKNMSIDQLTRLMSYRIARIEVLKLEIVELKRLIESKMREEKIS